MPSIRPNSLYLDSRRQTVTSRRPQSFVAPRAQPPSPNEKPNVGLPDHAERSGGKSGDEPERNVVAYVPLGGFRPFDELPVETDKVLRHREAVFVQDWKMQLVGRRAVWEGIVFTTTAASDKEHQHQYQQHQREDDLVRRQVVVQVRHDMYWDVPWNADFPPYDDKMYRKWRVRHWDRVLAEEVNARLEARRRSDAGQSSRLSQKQGMGSSNDDDAAAVAVAKRVVSMPARPRDMTLLFEDMFTGSSNDDDDLSQNRPKQQPKRPLSKLIENLPLVKTIKVSK